MSNKAEILLEGMRKTKANWTLEDLYALYRGYGIEIRNGNHPIVKHPRYPFLRGTLPNHKSFATGYVAHAVKLVEQYLKLEGNKK